MITVDKLVSGEPQSVQTGAPLLGLASWHLYPDMIVFGKGQSVKEVKQNDSLIHPGGILTLGIEDTRRLGDGIYWSLPLAHLRYYGDPVLCETALHSRTSRVSIDQLVYVALGSLIRRWCADADDIEPAMELLVAINRAMGLSFDAQAQGVWLTLLASAAQDFLASTGNRKLEILQLIKCGRRRYAAFVDDPRSSSIFGLSDPKLFLGLLPGNKDRVALLREIAKDFSDKTDLMVIQCKVGSIRSKWELSSVEPLQPGPFNDAGPGSTSRSFIRWIDRRHEDVSLCDVQEDCHTIRMPTAIPWLYAPIGANWRNVPQAFYANLLAGKHPVLSWIGAKGIVVSSKFLFGDPQNAALYSVSITWWNESPSKDARTLDHKCVRKLPNIFVIRHIANALDKQLVSRVSFSKHLYRGRFSMGEQGQESDKEIIISLKGLLTVWLLYKNFPDATVELKVASRPLWGHQWIPRNDDDADHFGPYLLTQEQTFACIAKFESGSFNFQASAMAGVLAISSGNSLYIARCLLQDPCEPSNGSIVERVVGNLGKSGMAMLVSPESPRVRPMTLDYALVNHHPFNGSEEDCFQQTTLHMSFTEWQLPIDVGSRGIRDVEAYYMEAAIGVYDRGKWVADVNILEIFRHKRVRIIPGCNIRNDTTLPPEDLCKLVAIDNWEELLDSPLEVSVVRARKNWQARLAAAALSIQRGHETRILPEQSGAREGKDQADINDEDDIIGIPIKPVDEEDSDSDMDEMVQQQAARLKKRKIDEVEFVIENQRSSPLHQINRNILYIL